MLNFESKEKERDQSFSDEIWAECVQRKLPQTALNTKFVVGIANGTLSVDNYAQFMMQDIIYLQHGSETWYRTAKQAKQQNKIDIQQYCEARGKSWQSYAKSLCDKYYVKPKGIVICDALNEYLEYESFVINKYGPEYVLVVFYACVKLWPFIGKTLKKNEDKENNNNLYQFWVDGNLSEKSATRNEKWMNKLYDQGKLDKTLCIKIVCNCIKLEINFFKQAFIQCDKDGDGLLNKSEFTQFVKVGFKKPSVPNGMYEQVCGHFKKDLDKGIDWLSAFALWKQSNPNAATAKSNTTSISASPSPNKKTTNNKKRPPNLKRLQTVGVISTSKSHNKSPRHKKNNIPPIGQLSPTKSTGQLYAKKHHSTESFSGSASALTERNLRALEKNNISTYKDDDDRSVDSERSYRSSRDRRHRRIVSTSRNAERLASFDDGVDATSMVVSMMETKVKNLQKSLNIERGKRKKTEELAQSLLTTNEEYKKQINEYTSKNTKLVSENIKIKPQLKKLKQQIDDDRNTIKHLKEQRNSKKNERDEAYQLLTKIEKEHSIMIKKEKAKHKEQMEKLSAGFLQSLGAEPGTDITTHIKQLKANNKDLQRKVDELAATLARKSESLVHALQAVDNLAMIDEKNQVAQYVAASQLVNEVQPAVNNNSRSSNKDKMKNKLKELNARRKSFSMNKNKDSASNISGLPKPPKRRNSQVGIKPHHRPTATFFKRAVGDHSTTHQNKLNISNAKNGKELQFVSQQLTSDVANKTQSIQNLELANTALMEQMEKMKKQMDDMKKKKTDQNDNETISDLP